MTPAAATTAPAPDLRFAEGSPNEDFIRAWNTFLVPKFVDYRWQLTRGAAAHADEFLRGLPIPVGGRALDVGCGFGESLHDLSDRVGPTGSVLGVDVGETYLQIAASELHAAGRDNVSLLKADAQIHEFAPEFDFVWSRNGTGFFASPGLGFRNMRRALKPGGTMGIIVWRSVAENSFFAMTKEVALELLPEPENPATCGPGPFSLSNPERLRALLTRADFEDITIERSDALYPVGRDLDHAVDFVLAIGPAGEIIREAGALGIEKLPEIRQRLRTRFAAYLQDGAVLMPSAMWRVSARAAG
ncbi:MAG: class I SAM-dependent methyltransferase [Myxococcota bacterium]